MPEYRDYSTAKDRQARAFRRSVRRTVTFALLICMILSVSWVITYIIEAPQKKAQAQSLAAAEALKKEQQAQEEAAKYGPVYGPDASALMAQPEAITPQQIALGENGRVDMKYFEDALFIGDSITQGLNEYASGIKNTKYAAYRGIGPKNMLDGTTKDANGQDVTYFDVFKAAAPKKIYIMLGTNSLNSNISDDAFIKYYGDLLDKLKQEMGEVSVFYVQSILPVTAKISQDERYAPSHIDQLNKRIADLAYARGMSYLDLNTAMRDDTGNLNESYAAPEGIHLNGSGYAVWTEYLITHTKHHKDNPYIIGSPFYVAPAQ